MTRVPVQTLLRFAAAKLIDAGLPADKATIVAETLVEGDLLGHTTHGTALLPRYLAEIANGDMARDGQPQITRTAGSVAEHWDGRWLPGPVLVRRAIDSASKTARRQGLGAVAIAKSHHIACLAAYLEAVTKRDLAVIIASSSPSNRQVAPYGAVGGVYSPNPIAGGWPTQTQPVMLDISMSIATSGLVSTMAAQGRVLPGDWLIDQDGQASSAPATLAAGGALLPAGGLDHGHKGFGLGLLVEMLTTGLAGHGRVEETDRWGASIFVLILDPAHFGGLGPFSAQASWLADACRAAPVPVGAPAVRLPGERGLKRKQEQVSHGIDLAPDLHSKLQALGLQIEEPVE